LALPGLSAELFHRWLALFRETTSRNPALRERADEITHRIAGSLWCGYQSRHGVDRPSAVREVAARGTIRSTRENEP
jgi:hemoglobin